MRRLAISAVMLLAATLRLAPAQGEVPPDLDPAHRHQKRHQLELAPFIGTYLGATLKKSWITGVHSQLRLSDLLAVGASYGYSHHAVNLLSCAGDELRDRDAHYLSGEVSIAVDAAMRVGRHVVQMDLYATLGAGALELNGDWSALGVIAGGVRFYTGLPWLAIRIDVDNYLHRIPLSTGDKTDVDVSFQLGIALLFPSGL